MFVCFTVSEFRFYGSCQPCLNIFSPKLLYLLTKHKTIYNVNKNEKIMSSLKYTRITISLSSTATVILILYCRGNMSLCQFASFSHSSFVEVVLDKC